MFQNLKFFPSVPQVKTVDSVISSFNKVLSDLKEVQANAIDSISEANSRIKILQDNIAVDSKESERAKSIITKIEGLLK